MESQNKLLASFGRRRGRKLSPRQDRLMEALYPSCAITLPDDASFMLDPATLFPGASEWWLEIGFGAGEHLAAQAQRHPNQGYIGCEVYQNGIVSLLDKIERQGLENVRLYTEDARQLMRALPEDSLAGLFLLFPDPWPKQRHHKRRIVSDEFLREAARIICPGGRLQLASDHVDYVAWMLEHVLACPQLEWMAECADDWRLPPPGWVPTRYETKTRGEGRMPTYITCRVK